MGFRGLIGDVIDRAVQQARGAGPVPEGALVGHPASAGRATGPVHLVRGPADFAGFADGDVLVAKATAPAWTPLFGRAAAVVADGGTLAAHASLVAREYGIPAVVGAGDATERLHSGQLVTVDGTMGVVTIHTAPSGPPELTRPTAQPAANGFWLKGASLRSTEQCGRPRIPDAHSL